MTCIRETLVADPKNAVSLNLIDSALFAICLEDAAPTTMHDESISMLHGSGQNRWFDKVSLETMHVAILI